MAGLNIGNGQVVRRTATHVLVKIEPDNEHHWIEIGDLSVTSIAQPGDVGAVEVKPALLAKMRARRTAELGNGNDDARTQRLVALIQKRGGT